MRSRIGHSAALLFLAVSSVYAVKVSTASAEPGGRSPGQSGGANEVRLIEEIPPDNVLSPTPAKQTAAVKSAPTMTMSDAGTFSIQINNDISLVEVLRMIANQSQTSIIPSKEIRGSVPAMDLYNVTVKEALDAILHTNGYAYRERGNFIFVYSLKEIQEIDKANRVRATEVLRVFYTPAANAANMIKPVLSTDAEVSLSSPGTVGLASGVSDVGGNSHATDDILVVTDYPENLERVRAVLKEIDRRPQQILIEATILRASLNEDNQLGVNFTVLGGVDFTSLSAVGSSGSGSGLSQALNGTIINNASATSVNENGLIAGSFGGAGMSLGVVKNNIGVFLNALEGVTDTTVLANPKVLALNKQKGEVIVGRKDGYLTTTVTESSSVQTVEFLDTGTRLIFRPFIGDDGFIRMEIHPEDSSGGLTSNSLPFKITTEVTSNVMVKDGHTIVIGGLFRESSTTNKSQVPFLGNLPLAGALFRQQRDQTTREEIIILLTPHIIKDDDTYAKASEAEQKEAEKLRTGVRQGMMFTGRERLSEAAYEKAVEEMAKPLPDRKKALWHLDMATNLNPKFSEAIQLKQQITGKEVSSVDNSNIRSFVRKQVAVDRANATTMPSVPRSTPITSTIPQPKSTEVVPTTTEPTATGPNILPGAVAHVSVVKPTGSVVHDQVMVVTQPEESRPRLPLVLEDAMRFVTPTTQPVETSELEPVELPTVTELPMDDFMPVVEIDTGAK